MNVKLKKYNKIVGFEISENHISAVEIQILKNDVVITNAFKLNISLFEDINKSVQYLKQTLKSSGIKTKDCVIGLSMQYFKLFPVPIPGTIPQHELDSIISQEGNVDMSNECFTWTPLTNTQRQDADGITRFDVLGITLKKNVADSLKHIFKKSDLNLLNLTPSFFGFRYYLENKISNNLFATLWVSQIKSEFIVWSGQDPIYENLFLTHQLNEQIFQSVNFIQLQLTGAQISVIYVCGPFSGEVDYSQIPFNIKPFSFSPSLLDKCNLFSKISLQDSVLPIGLAITATTNLSVNMPNLITSSQTATNPFADIFKNAESFKIPKSVATKLPFLKGKVLDPLIARFVSYSVLMLLVTLFSGILIKSVLVPSIGTDKSTSSYKLNLAEAQLKNVLNNQNTNKVLNIKVEYLSELIDKRIPWSKIIREIADVTPGNLWIDRMEIRNKNVDIFGRALNVDSVANFSINLNHTAKLLSNAQIIALRKIQEDEIDFIEFQVSVYATNKSKPIANGKGSKAANIPI